MILAAQMAQLMGNHILPIRFQQTGGQIDFGPDDAKDKWSRHSITNPYFFSFRNGFSDKPQHFEIAEHKIAQHQGYAKTPYKWDDGNRGLAANVCIAVFFLRSKYSGIRGHNLWMNQICVHCFLNDRSCLRNQTDWAFNGKRENQPYRNDCPENAGDPSWGFF